MNAWINKGRALFGLEKFESGFKCFNNAPKMLVKILNLVKKLSITLNCVNDELNLF